MLTSSSNILSSIKPARVNWRVSEFCEAHAIGRTLFYEEVKRGEITTIKIGRRTVIPDAEAKSWQGRKVGASK